MPSALIDWLEFSFQPANLITEVITDPSPSEGEEEMPTFFVTR